MQATKEELIAEIARLNDHIRELEDQLAKQQAVAQVESGWMISTPNPGYTGRTAGVYFENGHAFVPASHPNAARIVATLTNDFGYSATETAQGGQRLPQAIQAKKTTLAQQLVQPHVMGGKNA